MPIGELREEVLRKAHEDAQAILDASEKRSEEIVQKAKEDAHAILEAARKEAASILSGEKEERISAAKLEAQKMLSEAREKILPP